MNTLTLLRRTATLLALSLLVDQHAFAASETVTTHYPLAPDGHIHLENVNGSIEIRAWDGDGVQLEAHKKGRDESVVSGIRIEVESTTKALTIKTRLPEIHRGWWRGNSHEGVVDYVLNVPAGVRLDEVKSVNGAITVSGVKGSVRLTTVNGAIQCDDLADAAELRTVNGRIKSSHVDLPSEGEITLKTVNGTIDVTLPMSAGISLKATTVNGRVHSDIGRADGRKTKHRFEAQVGDGALPVELSTVNGGINVQLKPNEHASNR